ncbi:hypothetical protein ACUOAQ_01720, partial [Escherichia sp. SP-MK]
HKKNLWHKRYLYYLVHLAQQVKIAKDFCRPGEEVSSSIASKVFHAFIDLVNKIRGKKDFMYICTLCCFAEEVKGDYSHYRTFFSALCKFNLILITNIK